MPLLATDPDLTSGRVSLGDGDFVLKSRNHELYLEHEQKNYSKRVVLRAVSEGNAFYASSDTGVSPIVVQVELDRWSKGSLVGVVKLKVAGRARFQIFTISDAQYRKPWNKGQSWIVEAAPCTWYEMSLTAP